MHTVWDHIILNFIFIRPQPFALAIIIIIRDESVLVYGKLFFQKSCSCPSTRTIRRRRYTYRMESTFLITDGFWGTRRLEWYTYCAVCIQSRYLAGSSIIRYTKYTYLFINFIFFPCRVRTSFEFRTAPALTVVQQRQQ